MFITLKNKSNNIGQMAVFCTILLASFDIFMIFDVGSYSIRIAQIILCFAIVLYFARLFKSGRFYLPIGFKSLFCWVILQAAFVLHAPNFKNAVFYFCWLLLDVFIILVVQDFFRSKEDVERLLKIYIKSFYLLSWVGLIQMVLGLFGISFFVAQWWSVGIPRLNGFSYEPSYYSTYLLPGWVFVMYQLENGSSIFSSKTLKRYMIVISLALLLSTSRMGWVCMALWILFRVFSFAYNLSVGHLKKKKVQFLFLSLLFLAIGGGFFVVVTKRIDLTFLLNGLGLLGTSAHSRDGRIFSMMRAVMVFLKSPFIGYSLGGVDPAVAQAYNVHFYNGITSCVWVEVLVASGVIGIVFFIRWMWQLMVVSMRRAAKGFLEQEVKALFWAVVFECIILTFNQNVLRIYFWVLLAVVNTVYRLARQKSTE